MTKPRTELGPGDRQKGESARSHAAFLAYYEMGPNRSHAKVAQQLGKSVQLINRWSSKWSWVARVEALDAEATTARLSELQKKRIEALERQQRYGEQLQTLAYGHILKKYGTVDPETGEFRIAMDRLDHAARLLGVAADMERKALGISDKVELGGKITVEEDDDNDDPRDELYEKLSRLADAELAALESETASAQ